MSNPRAGAEGPPDGGNDRSLAKTAGFLVFSGIALSILKTLNPLNKNPTASSSESPVEAAQPAGKAQPPPLPSPSCETITKKPTPTDQFAAQPLQPTVEIVKGDTLWGLSQKYGVSVDAIKEANGLTGDTIYAGRKLIIPWAHGNFSISIVAHKALQIMTSKGEPCKMCLSGKIKLLFLRLYTVLSQVFPPYNF